MPTTRTRYVNAGSTGGDGTTNATSGAQAAYASLHAALTAEYAASSNLVSADVFLHILCEGTTQDGAAVTNVYPFATDATRYVYVECTMANRGATPWRWATDRYRISHTLPLNNPRNSKITFEGVAFRSTRNATDGRILTVTANDPGKTRLLFDECIFVQDGATNWGSAILMDTAATEGHLRLRNCLVSGAGAPTGVGVEMKNTHASSTCIVENCTIRGFTVNMTASGTGTYGYNAQNCLLAQQGTSCFTGTANAGCTNNATSDGTSAGANARTSQTFTFESGTLFSGDYRITAADAGAKGYGLNLSGTFTTDVAETVRTVPWDIGFFQVSVAAASGRRERITRGLHRGLSGVGV